ncbi:MAG: class I SAM-dependent methyltransferase [Paenibacillaceae bacterium]
MNSEQYVESLIQYDPILEKVKEGIRQEGMPEISIAPGYGQLLTLLVRMTKAQRVLEIGALGGYSGICLARGLSEGGKLISLDMNAQFAEVAKRHLHMAELGHLVEYRVGDASASLQQLETEGAKFDFVFIDADKGGYPHYLEKAIAMAAPGAVIVGDNTLMHGKTINPSANSPSVVAMRQFNERMTSDPRLEGMIIPAYDGLAIARVRS